MISIHRYQDNERFNRLILQMAETNFRLEPSSRLGVSTGPVWNSPKDFLDTVGTASLRSCIEQKSTLLLGRIPDIVQGWANIMSPGSTIGLHNHKDGINKLSGIYYLTYGETWFSGWGSVKAEPGTLVMFPPDLEHEVKEVMERRVTVAFNLW